MRIVISSRKSDLARIQAFSVGKALRSANLEVEFRFRESLGDKNLNDPLWKMPERGVFTEDFLQDLLNDKTDLVVHSWKDLPVDERAHTKIAATLQRADMRDLLLVRKDRWDDIKKRKTLNIFSSSPRRAYNLEGFLREALPTEISEVVFESVRGNVPTRIQKMLTSSIDGLVVAKAALDRLLESEDLEFKDMQETLKKSLMKCLVMILPLEKNPTAAAQGALALEINSKRDRDLGELLRPFHCKDTFSAVNEEREILKGYGGGCHQKVGVSIRNFDYGKITYIRALTDQGEAIDKIKFVPRKPVAKASFAKCFPQDLSEASWFKREPIDVELPTGPLWISKTEALPNDADIPLERLVWASGWETWKRLAKRGIWVSGCSEGLGEDLGLEKFALWKDINWTKLTHLGVVSGNKKVLGTYKLIPLEKNPDLGGKTHFYWTSGTSFERAFELNPWLKEANHSCGPGNSYDIVSKHIEVSIFPSYQIWKEHVTL